MKKAAVKIYSKTKISKQRLWLVAALFGVVGVYLIWHSMAATPVVATLEAERMALPFGAQTYSDSNASGGVAVAMYNNGSLTGPLTLASSADYLTVRVRESACRGDATFTVGIDGVEAAKMNATSSSWASYTVNKSLSSGTHNISISFVNDYTYRKKCDRNLFVDQSVFYGAAAPAPTPALSFSATPTSVSAGSAATLTWSGSNVSSCTAGGSWSGTEPTSGSVSTGALNTNSTYSLTCTGSYGTVSASTTVTVTATTTSNPVSLGLVTCCGGTTEESHVLAAGVKLIRTDRNDYELTFAHNNGIKVDGIIWMNTSSAGMGADIIELDNEPYFNNWNGLGGPSQWAVKARDVAKAVKAANPNKPVLLPLLTQVNNGDVLNNGVWQPMVSVINSAAPDIWQYVDGLAVHPYSRPNGPSFTVMDRVRSQLQAIGSQANKPFWVTEIGWPTSGSDGLAVSESLQAQYLGQFIDAARARSDVKAIMTFSTTDYRAYGADTSSEPYYGIYRMDGTQKPAFNAVYSRR